MARKTKKTAEKFSNRVRFNWGFHDAAFAVRNGVANAENNFGFAQGGPLAGLTCPQDVLRKHFDRAYAQGWQGGYNAASDGTYENDSEPAWNAAKFLGLVSD